MAIALHVRADMKNAPKFLILPLLALISLIAWTLIISTGMGVGPSQAVSALFSHNDQPPPADSSAVEHEVESDSAELALATPAQPESVVAAAPIVEETIDTFQNALAEITRERAELEKLRAEVGEMLKAKARSDSASLGSLAKMYDGLEPSQVAAVMANMDDSLVIAILPRLKSQKAGKILGSMPVERAARISSKLAGLN